MSDNKFQAWLKTLPRWQQLAVFSAIIMPLMIGADFIKAKLTEKVDTPEKCLAHLKGVWTFTEPLTGVYKTEPYWERFEFTDTGVINQTARPSDTNWGDVEKFGYSIKMEKTADTGEWYCRAKIDDTVLNIAVEKDGKTTLFRPLNPDMMDLPLTKKDKRLGA